MGMHQYIKNLKNLKMSKESILLTDGYKLDHRRQYPEGTEFVYSNWTPRSCQYFPEASEGTVVFGIEYFIKKYLLEEFNKNFFNRPKEEVIEEFSRRINTFLGPNQVGINHISALHDLGYLPIEIKALPEGTLCPIGVPVLTVINTVPEFFWITNYLETLMSACLWLPMTSATSARLYKKRLMEHALKTGFHDQPGLDFLCHDFSMRGMAGIEAAVMSGLGHLTSFTGSETIPALEAAEEYYNADADSELLAGTVPATEHSVMCAGGMEDEFETFKRLITEIYPTGIVSIVSDTWDFWQVITEYMPRLKDTIMSRDGRVVVRPDSGDPVKIICGDPEADPNSPEYKGAYQLLGEIFGTTVNEKGYKVLDTHIGLIYGDSITLERQHQIYSQLEDKGFAATNLVLGIGSYTYQFKSRDSLGFAMKATWCQINGEAKEIFKNPKTDSGMKKSLKGLLQVYHEDGVYKVKDQISKEEEQQGCLRTVFKNGMLYKTEFLDTIRQNVNATLHV
jgi:nicotinamide phosphoribosyltransferase